MLPLNYNKTLYHSHTDTDFHHLSLLSLHEKKNISKSIGYGIHKTWHLQSEFSRTQDSQCSFPMQDYPLCYLRCDTPFAKSAPLQSPEHSSTCLIWPLSSDRHVLSGTKRHDAAQLRATIKCNAISEIGKRKHRKKYTMETMKYRSSLGLQKR